MEKDLFKTRQQIAAELGVSYSSLYRKIKASELEIQGNLIPPPKVKEIKALFGVDIKVGIKSQVVTRME